MNLSHATREDAEAIFALQRLAYQTEAAIYDDHAIPPLTEKLEELQNQFDSKRFLKATEDNRIVGAVRAFQKGATCYVERLIVDPDYRRRGIGTSLLQQVETEFPTAERFELFTGHRSADNIRLYERVGYRPFRQTPVHERLTLIFLEKPNADWQHTSRS